MVDRDSPDYWTRKALHWSWFGAIWGAVWFAISLHFAVTVDSMAMRVLNTIAALLHAALTIFNGYGVTKFQRVIEQEKLQ